MPLGPTATAEEIRAVHCAGHAPIPVGVKFGGNGAPDWAVRQYLSDELGMREAVSDFWADPSLQDHLVMV
jgi:hypothetical protein